MAEQKSFPSNGKRSEPQHDVLGQIEGLQAELDELRSNLNSSFGELARPAASASHRLVKALIRARRKREAIFGGDLFADPAWDILLELYAAILVQRRVSISELCKAAAVPGTTALRWIEKLHRLEWLSRRADPLDSRRVFVELTPRATAAMHRYFEETAGAIVATSAALAEPAAASNRHIARSR